MRKKNCNIRKLLVASDELRVEGIDERVHVITRLHMLREKHISISETYVEKLLSPVVRLRILAKTHVLVEMVNRHVGPEVRVGEGGWNNLLS